MPAVGKKYLSSAYLALGPPPSQQRLTPSDGAPTISVVCLLTLIAPLEARCIANMPTRLTARRTSPLPWYILFLCMLVTKYIMLVTKIVCLMIITICLMFATVYTSKVFEELATLYPDALFVYSTSIMLQSTQSLSLLLQVRFLFLQQLTGPLRCNPSSLTIFHSTLHYSLPLQLTHSSIPTHSLFHFDLRTATLLAQYRNGAAR